MDKKTVDKLVELRKFLIEHHGNLDGNGNASTAIMKQSYAAQVYEASIKHIDEMLEGHVKFK